MSQDMVDVKERKLKSLITNDVFEVDPFENQVSTMSLSSLKNIKMVKRKLKQDW